MRRALICSLLTSLGACSNFETHPFTQPAPSRDARLKGLPFTLNRPVPTVTRTPGANGQPDTYAITMAYAADPTASYDVKLTPAWFSQTDFKLDYDANGSLTGVTAKFDNQTATILTSAAKLAVTLASAFDKTSADEQTAVTAIIVAMSEALRRNPVLIYDEHGASRPATAPEVREMRAAAPDLARRLKDTALTGTVASSFTFNSWAEEKLLRAALRALSFDQPYSACISGQTPAQLSPPAAAAAAPPLAAPAAPAAPPPPAQAAPPPPAQLGPPAPAPLAPVPLAPAAAKGVAAGTAPAGTICDTTPADQQKFAALYTARDLIGLQSAQTKVETGIENAYDSAAIAPPPSAGSLLPLQGQRDAAIRYSGMLKKDAAASLIFNILGRDSKAWQTTTVAQLDQQITTRKFEIRAAIVQGATIDESTDPRLQALVRKRAAMLGVATVYGRRQRLERLVMSERGKGEFKAVSEEIAYLDKRLSDAEPVKADTSTTKADAAAPAAFFQSRGENVTSEWIVNKLGQDWNRPKYIVVFDPSPSVVAGAATQGFAPGSAGGAGATDSSSSTGAAAATAGAGASGAGATKATGDGAKSGQSAGRASK